MMDFSNDQWLTSCNCSSRSPWVQWKTCHSWCFMAVQWTPACSITPQKHGIIILKKTLLRLRKKGWLRWTDLIVVPLCFGRQWKKKGKQVLQGRMIDDWLTIMIDYFMAIWMDRLTAWLKKKMMMMILETVFIWIYPPPRMPVTTRITAILCALNDATQYPHDTWCDISFFQWLWTLQCYLFKLQNSKSSGDLEHVSLVISKKTRKKHTHPNWSDQKSLVKKEFESPMCFACDRSK